jgi:dienelactone hydrolase
VLSSDRTFAFNLLRWHGLAPYRGTDVAELLDVADRIVPGDFESWHREFFALAERVEREGSAARFAASAVTERDRAFRAASYYRAADFFLHGNPHDPRIMRTWALATEQFDRAISLMDPAGERVAIAADGFTVSAIYYRAGRDRTPRPTVLMFNGFDGSQEEMLHLSGIAALERGFNVLTFEGPGQPTVVREQGIGFRHDWERVVTPVIDHCVAVPEIDASRLGLIGVSFGGYLAPRAAAFEPRIGAVVTVDGLFDAHQSVLNLLTPELEALLDRQDSDGFNSAILAAMDHDSGLRWYIQHGLWCFRVPTPYDFFVAARPYTLEGVAEQIACPVLVCAADDDHLNPGQAQNLAAALGNRATLRTFTAEESAGSHSHPGASMLLNGVVFDWLTATFQDEQPAASHQGHGGDAFDEARRASNRR